MICPVCHHKTKLLLCPEFSSSGLWCQRCSVNFGNPRESLEKLPYDLINAIEGWNYFWELYYDRYDEPTGESYGYFKRVFISLGKILNTEINKYYECDFYESEDFLFSNDKCICCDPIDDPQCGNCLGS